MPAIRLRLSGIDVASGCSVRFISSSISSPNSWSPSAEGIQLPLLDLVFQYTQQKLVFCAARILIWRATLPSFVEGFFVMLLNELHVTFFPFPSRLEVAYELFRFRDLVFDLFLLVCNVGLKPL